VQQAFVGGLFVQSEVKVALALQSVRDLPAEPLQVFSGKLLAENLKEGGGFFSSQHRLQYLYLVSEMALGSCCCDSVQWNEDGERLAHAAFIFRCRHKGPERDSINHLLSFSIVGSDAGPGLLCAEALVSLASALATGAGLATHGSAAMDIIADPFEVFIIHDRWGAWVNQNYLVELLSAVLCHPVGVENFHVAEPPAGSFLGDPLDRLAHTDGVHAHLAGLSVSLVTGLLPAAASHLDTRHDNALLGLVAERPRPVQAGGPIDSLHGAFLAPGLKPVLPQCAYVSLSGRGPGITDIAVKRLHLFSPLPVQPDTGYIPELEGGWGDRR